MIVYEFKAKGKDWQYKAIDEAILTSQFVRNKCLRRLREPIFVRIVDALKIET